MRGMLGEHVQLRGLIAALLSTAERLRAGDDYSWGHFGRCNCGHLAQTLTGLSPGEIHSAALERGGDWRERAREFCPSTGLRIDAILHAMLDAGLTVGDIADFEHLCDPAVLDELPGGRGTALRRNHRDDVIAYLHAWAAKLSRRLQTVERQAVAAGLGLNAAAA